MFFVTPLFSNHFNDVKIEMRVNGHSYFLDNDINTGIIEFWQNNKDIFNTKGVVMVFYRMCYKYLPAVALWRAGWTPNGVRQMAGWNNRYI